MKKTKLLIVALLASVAAFSQTAPKKDTAEKRLILNLSALEVAQLQAQLDNAGYFANESNLPHQKVKAVIQVCRELQGKIEAAKSKQWPAPPAAKADTIRKSKK